MKNLDEKTNDWYNHIPAAGIENIKTIINDHLIGAGYEAISCGPLCIAYTKEKTFERENLALLIDNSTKELVDNTTKEILKIAVQDADEKNKELNLYIIELLRSNGISNIKEGSKYFARKDEQALAKKGQNIKKIRNSLKHYNGNAIIQKGHFSEGTRVYALMRY